MLSKLNRILTNNDKKVLIFLFFFSILISIIETAGISVIMPFMAIATDFNQIHSNEYYNYFYKLFNFNDDVSFVITFGIILVFYYIFRSLINLLYSYSLNKFSLDRYNSFANKLFQNYMGMPYRNFINKNSSTLTKAIVNEALNLTQLISATLSMVSEIFILILIYSILIYVNYQITLFLTLALVINGILVKKIITKRIKKAGNVRATMQKEYYEIINRSFGNFKLIKLQYDNKDMIDKFSNSCSAYANAISIKLTLSDAPRLFLEALAFGIIVSIITYLVWQNGNNISSALSIISIFVLGLYRLMPSVNRIMGSYHSIVFNIQALNMVYEDLLGEIENIGNNSILFTQSIQIKNLSFEFEKNKPILNNINLEIKKNSKIAFIGESGSGKSTLVDILMGLYKLKEGYIYSDNELITEANLKSWRSKIGYIPQTVYLFDGTVGENIAVGYEYDEEKLNKVLKQAKIYDFLIKKDGINTKVGEGGVMLSGGQKQRVAIARALYSEPEILVLDEATSALDDDTEKQIMDEIYEVSEGKTLIIIAHRLSTIDRCEKIYKLENGHIN